LFQLCYYIVLLFFPPSLIFFFFLMTPPPPRSTLFPYTTLFRSLLALDEVESAGFAEASRFLILFLARAANWPSGYFSRYDLKSSDRKSTRLNSSHVAISYAVFCLKKKKKKKKQYKI